MIYNMVIISNLYTLIHHRALCRVRGNEASRPRDTFYTFFGVLPNFTDLIQVSTYLEDCFVLLIQVLGAPTPSARVNLTTLAEHLQNTCVNREPHSRSCWLILALLVGMMALLVAILSLLLVIFSPTCPKTFQKKRIIGCAHAPPAENEPPKVLRTCFRQHDSQMINCSRFIGKFALI